MELHIPWGWMLDTGVVGQVGATVLRFSEKLLVKSLLSVSADNDISPARYTTGPK